MRKSLICLALSLVMVLGTMGMASAYTAGTYEATTTGHNAPITLAVTVNDSAIEKIDVTVENETIGVGKVALETMTARIIENQSLAVDTLTGATVTSYAVIRATTDALTQAGGDMDALKAAQEKAPAQDAEYAADVVVVGGGGAGLAAAISAEQNGASVIVIEKLDILGGSTNVSEGALNAVDPKRQGAQGIEDSFEKFITQTYEGGHQIGDMDLITYMCENSMKTIEWMESIGVQFKDECGTATGALWQRSHYPVTPSGNSYIRVYADYISKTDKINLLMGTTAESLITEEGKVVGVTAKGKGGETVTVKRSSSGRRLRRWLAGRKDRLTRAFSRSCRRGSRGSAAFSAVRQRCRAAQLCARE